MKSAFEVLQLVLVEAALVVLEHFPGKVEFDLGFTQPLEEMDSNWLLGDRRPAMDGKVLFRLISAEM
ncbi:MAG: hypothetical protein R3C97_11320 [Geminicoccaceae bacterium]